MYMVVFTTAQGRPGYHQSEELEEAVRFIEHLRNSESVDDAKLYRMSEVPLEVKAYYKVEIAGGNHVTAREAIPSSAGPAS